MANRGRSNAPPAGLCDSCLHGELLRSKTSVYLRCARSRTDERFARYPLLPVRECPGWESGAPGDPARPSG